MTTLLTPAFVQQLFNNKELNEEELNEYESFIFFTIWGNDYKCDCYEDVKKFNRRFNPDWCKLYIKWNVTQEWTLLK